MIDSSVTDGLKNENRLSLKKLKIKRVGTERSTQRGFFIRYPKIYPAVWNKNKAVNVLIPWTHTAENVYDRSNSYCAIPHRLYIIENRHTGSYNIKPVRYLPIKADGAWMKQTFAIVFCFPAMKLEKAKEETAISSSKYKTA